MLDISFPCQTSSSYFIVEIANCQSVAVFLYLAKNELCKHSVYKIMLNTAFFALFDLISLSFSFDFPALVSPCLFYYYIH